MQRLGAILALAVSLAACGKSTTDASNTSATGDFDITIGSGLHPTYTWPGGTAFSISVVRVSAGGTIVWGVAKPGSMDIASPVTHGTVPSGAIATATTEATLTAGVAYRVSITRADQKTGYKEFTR